MKTYLIAAIIAMFAGQAHALSCIRPDPIDTFKRVSDASESYYILYGQLSFDENELPDSVSSAPNPSPSAIDAYFQGKGLTREGFTSDYAAPITLQPTCAGPWCGSASSDTDAIYFVKSGSDPAVIQAEPCGGTIFPNPSDAVLNMLTSCMQGGTCSAQPLQ